MTNSHLRKLNNTVWLTKKCRHKAQINRNVTSSISRTLQLINYDNSLVNRRIKKLTFKNIAPFRSCRSKINNTFIDNAEDLDIVTTMYNLSEFNDNYSITSGSLWNYYRDEVNDDANEINTNCRLNNSKDNSK